LADVGYTLTIILSKPKTPEYGMKNLFTLLCFMALSVSLMAQSMNTIGAFNNFSTYEQTGGTDKAALRTAYDFIKKAEVHETTISDAKTWYYSAYISLLINEDVELKKDYPEVIYEATKALRNVVTLGEASGQKKPRFMEEAQEKLGITTVILYNKAVDSGQAGREGEAYKAFKETYDVSMFIKDHGFEAKNKLPEVKEAKYYTAMYASKLGKTEEAQKLFDELINEGYNSANLYQGLAMMQKNAGKNDEAVATLQKGMKVFPNELALVIDMINIYLETGRETEAIDAMLRAIELDPKNHQLYFVTGVAYAKIKNNDKALEYYNKALEVKPDYSDAYNNIGAIYLEFANEQISKMGEPNVSDAQYKQYDAKRLEFLGKSLPALEKSNELNPNNIETMDVLRTIYAKLGQYDKSAEMKKKIAELQK
jgi:tetratricopeptide (TPR) repeat protein